MLHISLLHALKADLNHLIESQNTILLHRCRDADFEHGQRAAYLKALQLVLNKEEYIRKNPDSDVVPIDHQSFKEKYPEASLSQTYKIDV